MIRSAGTWSLAAIVGASVLGCSLGEQQTNTSGRQATAASGPDASASGSVELITDAAAFLDTTGAALAVDFPSAASWGSTYTENGVTIRQVDGFSVGVLSDRSAATPGNEFAVSGPESIDITLPTQETHFGMYIEDSTTDPNSLSACPKNDSSFTFTFRSGGAGGEVIDSVSVEPPSNQQFFVGVVASAPFDRVEIREDGAQPGENAGPHCENDYFGDIYLGGQSAPSCDKQGSSGDWHYCSEECPCEEEEGDCDSDSECAPGLTCVKGGIGAQFGHDEDVDICMATCHRSPLGGFNHCGPDCLCEEGEGDCDSDDECAPGLTCVKNVGADFGFDSDADVCLATCHASATGTFDYCSEDCPCEEEEGDCDSNDECAPGLTCVKNVGADFGFDSDADVCLATCHPSAVGGFHYCSPDCPCEAGEGDCDSDADCGPGLTCVKGGIGASYGWDEDVDVCEPVDTCGAGGCESFIVNISSRVHWNAAHALHRTLQPGSYVVEPVGPADGGDWTAWNAWSHVRGCDSSGVCSHGWIYQYRIFSDEFATIGHGTARYQTPEMALANAAGASFCLPQEADVGFTVGDSDFFNNSGGISLRLTRTSTSCDP